MQKDANRCKKFRKDAKSCKKLQKDVKSNKKLQKLQNAEREGIHDEKMAGKERERERERESELLICTVF